MASADRPRVFIAFREIILVRGPQLRRWVLLVVLAGVPLLFVRPANDPFNVPKLALLVTGVALAAIIRIGEITQGGEVGPLGRRLMPPAVFLAPLVISWIFSPYRAWALWGDYGRFQGLIPYAVVILLGVLLADAFYRDALPIAQALSFAGAGVGAYAIFQVLGVDPLQWASESGLTDNAVSTLGNPNFTGGFLAIALPACIALAVRAPDRRWLKLLVVIAGGWVLSFSQGAWLAGIAGASVTLGLILGQPSSVIRRLGAAIGAAVIAISVGAVVWGMMDSGRSQVPKTVVARSNWWIAAMRMAGDAPVLGHGPNTFAIEGVRYRTLEDALQTTYEPPDDPHSVVLALLSGSGVLGAGVFLWIFLWVAKKAAEIEPWNRVAAGFAGASVSYFAQAVVSIDEVSLRTAFWTVLGGLVAALAPAAKTTKAPKNAKMTKMAKATKSAKTTKIAKTTKQRDARVRRPPPEPLRLWPVVALLLVAALFSLYWGFGLVIADVRARQGALLYSEGKAREGELEFQHALGFREEPTYRRMHGLSVGQYGSTQGGAERYLVAMKRSFSYLSHITDVNTMVEYARLLRDWPNDVLSTETKQDALRVYAAAMEADPLDPVIRSEHSVLLIEEGRYEEVVAGLTRYVTLVRTNADIWGELALAYAHLGRTEEAKAAAKKALALAPKEGYALQALRILSST